MARLKKEPLSELEKIAQKIGDDWKDVLQELEASDSDGLKNRVTQASQSIHDAQLELENNINYLQAKNDVKLLSSSFKELKKRQNAVIKVCLQLRVDRGEA